MSYWEFLVEYVPKLANGAVTTVMVMICATLVACAISLIFGLMRLSHNWAIQKTCPELPSSVPDGPAC